MRGSAYLSGRSEEHTSELQSHSDLVCRLLLEKKKIALLPCKYVRKKKKIIYIYADNKIVYNFFFWSLKNVLKYIEIFSLSSVSFFFFLMIRRPPRSTLFPYTTSSDLDRRAFHRADGGRSARGPHAACRDHRDIRSEEHTSELQSHSDLVCRLLLEK